MLTCLPDKRAPNDFPGPATAGKLRFGDSILVRLWRWWPARAGSLLLGAHSHRLGREDLEDCYSQATLELLARARRERRFASPHHIANALEQRFLSRIHDRRRALSGRSPIEAAIAPPLPLGDWEGGVDRAGRSTRHRAAGPVAPRPRLICRLACQLSPDQRLVLKNQLADDACCEEFCREHGWSEAKYRKVGQRARTRLAALLAQQSEVDLGPSEGPFAARCPVFVNPSD